MGPVVLKIGRAFLVLLLSLLFHAAWHDDALSQEKQVVGWLEMVHIYPGDLIFRAKLDTGAKHSSLNARHIVRFDKDGEPWVRFTVTDRHGKQAQMQKPIVRDAEIKLRGKDRNTQKRLVVILGICLGTAYKEVEVNLVDRSNFNYQMLIGRSYLNGVFLVDAGKIFLRKPQCRMESRP